MRCHLLMIFMVLAGIVSGQRFTCAADADSPTADEQMLRAARLGTDGPALLDLFRKHTLTDADRERIDLLIKQLGNRSFRVRQKASADLVSMGPKTIALLRLALKDRDLEVGRRAEACLRQVENSGTFADPLLWSATVRVLAVRKPAGGVEVLLGYLPVADAAVLEEIQSALAVMAVREGKPEPALVKSLTAAEPLRRGIAGAAMAKAAVVEQRGAIRKLLQDPEAGVRLRVGLALAGVKDKTAVPALIDLLGTLPPDRAWPIEELLARLAQERAPAVSLGADAAGRGKCRDAWAAWWRDQGGTINMADVEGHRPQQGFTLIVTADYGTVEERDRDGKRRWQIGGLQSPFYAQVLPGERVLIAEYSGQVTERNLKGEILWRHSIPRAMQCQRLPNGNTFIVTPTTMLEVDPRGNEIARQMHNNSLIAARKLRNGQIVSIDGHGVVRRQDATGKELRRFTVGLVSNNCMEVLPSGHILVSKFQSGKITEYDAEGKALGDIPCVSPFSTHRLPGGNTLVACYDPPRVVELDRAGKVVREYKVETLNHRPWFASRR